MMVKDDSESFLKMTGQGYENAMPERWGWSTKTENKARVHCASKKPRHCKNRVVEKIDKAQITKSLLVHMKGLEPIL